MAGSATIPAAIDSDALYAREIPSILVDRALSLQSTNPISSRPNSTRAHSGVGEDGDESDDGEDREAELVRDGEGDSLLAGNADIDYARSRSSSKAARHSLPWYKRPSPVWSVPHALQTVELANTDALGNRLLRFFPGTLVRPTRHGSGCIKLTSLC